MIFRAVLVALITGLVAGLFVTAIQSISVVPLITQAETYETASHDEHAEEAWTPRAGLERAALTGVANSLIGMGFAALLIAGFLVRRRPVGWRRGLLWGGAGFYVFAAAPALGLPPELPGVDAAALSARQMWWGGTVLASATGIWALAFGRNLAVKTVGALLLVGPHLAGAPRPEVLTSHVPALLAAEFAVASLAASVIFWVVLGTVAGSLFDRWVIGQGD